MKANEAPLFQPSISPRMRGARAARLAVAVLAATAALLLAVGAGLAQVATGLPASPQSAILPDARPVIVPRCRRPASP